MHTYAIYSDYSRERLVEKGTVEEDKGTEVSDALARAKKSEERFILVIDDRAPLAWSRKVQESVDRGAKLAEEAVFALLEMKKIQREEGKLLKLPEDLKLDPAGLTPLSEAPPKPDKPGAGRKFEAPASAVPVLEQVKDIVRGMRALRPEEGGAGDEGMAHDA